MAEEKERRKEEQKHKREEKEEANRYKAEKDEARKYKEAEKEEKLKKGSGQPTAKKPTGHHRPELLAVNSDSSSYSDSSSREQDSRTKLLPSQMPMSVACLFSR